MLLLFSLHGDLKSFFVIGQPRDWFSFSADSDSALSALGLSKAEALDLYGLSANPYAQGSLGGRLKGMVQYGNLRFDVHWAIALQSAGVSSDLPGLSTGVGLQAPELLPLSWNPDTGDALQIRHRIDRLSLSYKWPGLALSLGRQAISFGVGHVFSPLDVVNPFHPATIDTEYKPGVDALRLDMYAGMAGHLSLVGAWAGPTLGQHADFQMQDVILATAGQATVGITDLLGFAGWVRNEPVVGLGTVSALGPVGIHAEASLTLPKDQSPFVRAVVGADGRPTATTSLSGEVYLQTFGAKDPQDYLAQLDSPRFTRGEVWQMGQWYAALSVAQEIGPLLYANLSLISNLRDPSALLATGASWSVADNADVVFGGYFGLGPAPSPLSLQLSLDPQSFSPVLSVPDADAIAQSVRSEFGLYPSMGYVQLRMYF